MNYGIKNFNVLITGGTGNLGKEIVREFLKGGARVATNYRNKDKFQKMLKEMGQSGQLTGYAADLTKEEAVISIFKDYKNDFKRLDIFLHLTGGFWMGGEITDTPLEKWQLMQDMNVTSTFLCAREAFRLMKAQCGGKIFTVSSRTAQEYPASMGAYAVSKSGVLALSQVLANEGKAYNIQVNCLLPSIIDTPVNRQSMPDADFSQWVTPQDIARLLIHLSQAGMSALSHSHLKVFGKL